MARFITQKSVAYFNYINRHLLEDFMGTTVIIFKSSPETTSNFYGESINKVYESGITIEAFIENDDASNNPAEYGPDYQQSINILFLRDMLAEVNLDPEEGDIIKWNDRFYEIDDRLENQLIGGDPTFSFSNKYKAHLTKLSNLDIDREDIRD